MKTGIRLETLAGGALAEKVDEALVQVVRNIQDPNTEAKARRRVTIAIDFAPGKTRQAASVKISVTAKLAPAEAIDTQMLMGYDIRTGELGVSEIGDQISGQMNLADFSRPEEPERKPDTAAGQAGRPLDLKNRPIPGKDADPDTGEIMENQEKIVDIGQRAAQ